MSGRRSRLRRAGMPSSTMQCMRLRAGTVLIPAVAASVLAACSSAPSTTTGAAPVSSATTTSGATAPAEPTATSGPVTPGPIATPAPSARLAGCPAPRPITALPVLARPPVSPDDLLAMPDGSLWISDPVSGAVVHVDPSGRLLQRIDVGQAPEGMVAVGGGRIVLAEQTLNRLVTFTPPGTATTTVDTLPARGTADGVDGIAPGAGAGTVLVPDSPHGTLLVLSLDNGSVRGLASGLGRDVAAAVGPDGAVWVAVEGGRGLWRVPAAGGAAEAVGRLSQLDDVVSAGGLLYVTALAAGEVVAVDPQSGADAVLVTGIGSDADSAQGLAVLPDGRLAVADSSSRVVAVLAPCR